MFFPLPKETVLEAREKARRDTKLLFAVLVSIYLVFSNLIAFSTVIFLFQKKYSHLDLLDGWPLHAAIDYWQIGFWTTLISFFVAVLHFMIARSTSLKDALIRMRAYDADLKDERHKQFQNIVDEARLATGLQNIQAVVVNTPALNAFSMSDLEGKCAIGVTEGLLSKLDRSELSAVIAHEATHLVNNDSSVTTLAYSLFSVFDKLDTMVLTHHLSNDDDSGSFGKFKSRIGSRNILFIIILKILSSVARFITHFLCMAISRKREHLADAGAVAMCKDPLSMSEALYKISRSDRGGRQLANGFSGLFILNPEYSFLDEDEGMISNLFSTHPPVTDRMKRLMNWANADLDTLKKKLDAELGGPDAYAKQYFVQKAGEWKGPVNADAAMMEDFINPSTWIAAGNIIRAHESQDLKNHFDSKVKNPSSKACPRCQVLLSTDSYEGAPVLKCDYCKGYLLNENTLVRIALRKEQIFEAESVAKTLEWRKLQKGTLKDLCALGPIRCPLCKDFMFKKIYNELTRVVIDQCYNEQCKAIWLDQMELERIQILIEESQKLKN